MTQLLVSVRNAEEAAAALAGGADFVDVKEPHRGALGWAAAAELRAVAAVVAQRVPLSAALGELVAPNASESFAALSGYQYAKLGLAEAAGLSDWRTRWRRAIATLPDGVRSVAVAYADWQRCGAPSPVEVFDHARAHDCAALLVDTFHKDGSTAFDAMTGQALAQLVASARAAGLMTVVAGSLHASDLPAVVAVAPDVVAVRGVVCRGDRTGTICAALVAKFRAELARNSLIHVRARGVAARR